MKAKRKELRRDALDTYGVAPMLTYLSVRVQVKARQRTMIDGKDPIEATKKLVHLLRNEARVI